MPPSNTGLLLAAIAGFCANAYGQRARPVFPPDLQSESVDIVKLAPNRYTVELENPQVRVLRARIPAVYRVPIHSQRAGLLVAITEVHLRFTRPDGGVEEIHLPPGGARWLQAGIHSEENLNLSPCEFLFVESKLSN